METMTTSSDRLITRSFLSSVNVGFLTRRSLGVMTNLHP